ncbi:G-protein coupled receptor Mth2-like [Homalodisca vitripennis]|uniref:G-protein coupled receptor Mth2-like n=1 Tax=Homalodisca vitripennis TaxID=197043 RepID=UPI001EEC1B33|nr:G-protein coupled receptor Mth2-like [Homalodisca vitripennis]KAG8331605.1 hypothetical protein J6590_038412 [Homalodisca vitripennis]
MSGVLSVILRAFKRLPIKGVIVVLYIVGVLAVNWHLRDDPSVEDRCSPEYPELSENLDMPTVTSDGSILDDKGRIFSTGQYWSEDEGVFHGCPCSGDKPCIRKCCKLHQAYNYNYTCVDSFTMDIDEFTNRLEVVRIVDNEIEDVNVAWDYFTVLSSECEYSNPLPPPHTLKHMQPMDTGVVVNTLFGSTFDQSQYCLESFIEGTVEGENEVFVVVCQPTPQEKEHRNRRLWQSNLVYYVLRVVSVILNLVSLSVFGLLPELRSGCGKSIMCYLICRIYLSLDDIINLTKISPTNNREIFCFIGSYVVTFSLLASRTWQLVIAYQIWSAFRPGHSSASGSGLRTFLLYSAVAWGAPVAVILVALVADLYPSAPEYFKPRFAEEDCWFNNGDAQFVYYVVPYYAIEMLVMVLCVTTIWQLHVARQDSAALHGSESRRHNIKDIQWSRLYMKTAVVMGVNYALLPLVVFINKYYPTSRFIKISILNIDDIRGAEIFLIFVLKQEIVTQVVQRLMFWQRSP